MRILGHPLPDALWDLLRDGRRPPVFAARALPAPAGAGRADVRLYDLAGMQAATARFLSEHDRALLGHPDADTRPGNLDPQRCVILGEYGDGRGRLLALDYRGDPGEPEVVLLRWSRRPERHNRWVTVAGSFAAFMLGLGWGAVQRAGRRDAPLH
jgi:hypothetical protein